MEKPYTGRAILQDNLTNLQIIIPAKRNWFVVIFISGWLSIWLTGGLSAVVGLFWISTGSYIGLFHLFWFIIWAVGSFFSLQVLLWNVAGKEIITVGQGMLSVVKKGTLLHKLKVYDLNEVRNLRVLEEEHNYGLYLDRRRTNAGPYGGGSIRFNYGLRTVHFASGIDEAEALFIVDQLKKRHFLTAKNYT